MRNNEINNVNALNKILKGEYMAIATYENYSKKVQDKELAHKLLSIIEDHKNHAYILASRVEELGAEPEDNTSISSIMTDMINAMKTFAYTDKFDLLKELYGGENKGISSALEIAEKELSEYDKQLVEEMMAEDYTHLKTLNNLMENYQMNVVH